MKTMANTTSAIANTYTTSTFIVVFNLDTQKKYVQFASTALMFSRPVMSKAEGTADTPDAVLATARCMRDGTYGRMTPYIRR